MVLEFISGRISLLLVIILVGAVVLTCIDKARKGMKVKIRRVPGLDTIDEAIGRATEMGRPVHFTPGIGSITSDTAPQTFAGLEILGYVAGMTAKYDTDLIVSLRVPVVFPLAASTVQQSYLTQGKPQAYNENMVRFISTEQFAFAAGVIGILNREQAAANLMMGYFMGEAMVLAESGAQVGAIQVAGTALMAQIPFFVVICDYTLIGEELFVGGAYLSRDPVKLGSILGQDIIKAVIAVVVLLGVVCNALGMTWLLDLLQM